MLHPVLWCQGNCLVARHNNSSFSPSRAIFVFLADGFQPGEPTKTFQPLRVVCELSQLYFLKSEKEIHGHYLLMEYLILSLNQNRLKFKLETHSHWVHCIYLTTAWEPTRADRVQQEQGATITCATYRTNRAPLPAPTLLEEIAMSLAAIISSSPFLWITQHKRQWSWWQSPLLLQSQNLSPAGAAEQ